jgi:hypothetical protein
MELREATPYLAQLPLLVAEAAHEELAEHLALLVALEAALVGLLELILVALVTPQAHRHHKEIMAVLEQIAPLNMAAAVAAARLLLAGMGADQPLEMAAQEPRLVFPAVASLMLAVVAAVYGQLEPLEQVVLVAAEPAVINPLLQLLEPLTLAAAVAQVVVVETRRKLTTPA